MLVGAVCGAAIGAASFATSESLFGRGIGVFSKSPHLAALIGVVFIGVPSLIVGGITGGFYLSKSQGAAVGAATGLCMILLFVLRSERKYFYEGGYFDKQFFLYDVLINATWLFGLALVAMVVSASVSRLFALGR